METASVRNRPEWFTPAQQLVVEVTDCFTGHARGCDATLAADFEQLLLAAHQLERFSRSAAAGTNPDHRNVWRELRRLVGELRTICERMEQALEMAPFSTLLGSLRNIGGLCEQFLQRDERHSDMGSLITTHASNVSAGTVMIVDSSTESREQLVRYVQRSGHKPLPAQSEQAMLQVLCTMPVDLILIDLGSSEQSGLRLLRELKSSDEWRHIPVVVMSGSAETESVVRCIEAGAEDYLFKPLNPVLLRARIGAGIERKRWLDRESQYRSELERNERFIRKVFGRYLSAEIVETLLGDPEGLDLGGIQRTVTVMMADIRGFTTICEKLPPNRVVTLLNNYLGTMADIIMKHSGTVDEFIGDAILAIFGAPISRTDDADRAIECALEMQRAMKQLNLINMQEGLPPIAVGISLNTGPVIAGNIGSEKRSKYGVVGHTVNQTARIEEHCPGDAIYVAKSTLQATRKVPCIEEHIRIQAKGIHQALEVYRVAGMAPTS